MKDKEHKMNCNKCGQEFDMRDLSQVFAHEPCNGNWVDYTKLKKINKTAKEVKKPILHVIGKEDIYLN
jgi:poly-D-alanine transfer protein DltD